MQVCHRWMRIRAVTKPACTSKVRSRWSILLTSEKLNEGESHTHLTTHSGRRAHRRSSISRMRRAVAVELGMVEF
jgi:hypothetical protein